MVYSWFNRLILTVLSKKGATTAEYALLLALVVVILIGSLSLLGSTLEARLESIVESINAAN